MVAGTTLDPDQVERRLTQLEDGQKTQSQKQEEDNTSTRQSLQLQKGEIEKLGGRQSVTERQLGGLEQNLNQQVVDKVAQLRDMVAAKVEQDSLQQVTADALNAATTQAQQSVEQMKAPLKDSVAQSVISQNADETETAKMMIIVALGLGGAALLFGALLTIFFCYKMNAQQQMLDAMKQTTLNRAATADRLSQVSHVLEEPQQSV
ncbi:unnamed protein product [Amoebophrya sp. A120]|nr:unnamed protein product [Amoebophrya sp. A120]|eukprot:GSA120T00018076001.1